MNTMITILSIKNIESFHSIEMREKTVWNKLRKTWSSESVDCKILAKIHSTGYFHSIHNIISAL